MYPPRRNCILVLEGCNRPARETILMPIYEFECKKCKAVFEALRPIGDTGRTLACPRCDTKAPKKIFSVFAAGSGSCAPASSGFG